MSDLRSTSTMPSVAEIEAEIARTKRKRGSRRSLAGIFAALVVIAALAVLVSTQLMPVMKIQGDSMEPTLEAGDVVVALDFGSLEAGDIVAFEHDGQILVKRIVAVAGDEVEVNDSGTLLVNGSAMAEPYVSEKSLGRSNVGYPRQVPEGCFFVMGDNRPTSIDSRNSAVSFVSEEQVIGELVARVYPLEDIELL